MEHIRFISMCFAVVLFAQVAPAQACSCVGQGVTAAKKSADIVFAGRVEEVTHVDEGSKNEPRVIVRFTVARVWKGPVTQSFTMHSKIESMSCAGFTGELLKPGTTLIVYGNKLPASAWKDWAPRRAPGSLGPIRQDLIDAVPDDGVVYSTDICTRTNLVINAAEDFKKLGKAQKLGPLDENPARH